MRERVTRRLPGGQCRFAALVALGVYAMAVALTVGTLLSSPLQAQAVDSIVAVELRDEVEESFVVLVLQNGVALAPREPGEDFRAIEISDGEIAVDGEIVDSYQLEDLLGDRAEPVLALAELSPDNLREVFTEPAIEAEIAEIREIDEIEAEFEAREDVRRPKRPRRPHLERNKLLDAQVVVGSSLTIEEDEVAEEAVVVGGSLEVMGKVLGDAVALGGSAEINGEVLGDVMALGGPVRLGPNAEVMGEVTSVGGKVKVHPDAVVHGAISDVPFSPGFRLGWLPNLGRLGEHDVSRHVRISPFAGVLEMIWPVFAIVVLALLALLVLLIGRAPVERVAAKFAAEPWKAGLVGLAAQLLAIPLLAAIIVLLVVSIIGIPLLILVPFVLLGLLVLALIGYTGVAYQVGRWARDRFSWSATSPYVILLIGVLGIEVWCLMGHLFGVAGRFLSFFTVMFFIFGALVEYVAWTVGFGAVILTRLGSADDWRREAQAAPTGAIPSDLPHDLPDTPESSELDDTAAFSEDEVDWEEGDEPRSD